MITFKNVTKKFKNEEVLKDLSFNVNKGELVVLIGKSGCGKTTSLKMINALIRPTSGSIEVQGRNIKDMDVIELRRTIGYVIQQTGLFPHMSVKENIQIIPRLQKLDEKEIEKRTNEVVEMVGLSEDQLNRYPSELSGGQQQRVGVARAFACNPEIVLMDEPFSALDPMTKSILQDELIDLQDQLKKTIVFVTHDMDEAVKIADRICIMDGGKIVQYDTPENILKNPANDFVSGFVGKKRIWSSPEYIKAEDIMLEEPVVVSPNVSVFRAIEKMRTNKVDSLMVIDQKSKQLLGALYSKGIQLHDDQMLVQQVMKKDVITVHPDDSIIEILTLINDNDISGVPVVDEAERLVGLITKGSLITTLSQQYIEEVE